MAKLFYALVLKILWFFVLLNAYYMAKSGREYRRKLTSASEASFWIHHGETVGKANWSSLKCDKYRSADIITDVPIPEVEENEDLPIKTDRR